MSVSVCVCKGERLGGVRPLMCVLCVCRGTSADLCVWGRSADFCWGGTSTHVYVCVFSVGDVC